jgi:hypothetical protein
MGKRQLDRRYKAGVDSGAMSHLTIPLPIKSYSALTLNPKSPTARELHKEAMIKKGKEKKIAEKLARRKKRK